jgi:photosystem II stability/assembly factor-like uncharacterized protein
VLSSLKGAGAGKSMALLAAAESTVLCSRNGGDTWRGVLDVGEDAVAAVALSTTYAQDRTALAGTSGGQVYLSVDGGTSWAQAAVLDGEMVVALTARTVRGNLEIVAVTARQSPEGAWLMTLGTLQEGAWRVLRTRAANEPVAVLDLCGEDGLLCAIGQEILYLAQGELVSEFALDGPAPVSCFAATGEVLLAGTRLGVYRSTDQGQSWASLSEDVGALAMHCPSPDQAYVVSMGGNLWLLDLGAG